MPRATRRAGMLAGLIAVYFGLLGGLAALSLLRARLLWRQRPPNECAPPPPTDWPPVLVQIPLYNEANVAERILRHAAALRYPRSRLVLQVLDDSTDDTTAIVDRVAAELRREGTELQVLRRPERAGYKAGALAHGLGRTTAPFIAIFDADFCPRPDFLERGVASLLADPDCALWQARWGHLNRDATLGTRAQAVFLDGHFAVEHRARSERGYFFNFNGTAGIWRRSAIEAAGGWQADSVTEDLDLSLRAHLGGARFRFDHDTEAPAELPRAISAFRSQQSRWAQGSAACARRYAVRVATGPMPARVKFDALLYLGQNLGYPAMTLLATILPWVVFAREHASWRVPFGRALLSALDLGFLGMGTASLFLFYWVAEQRVRAPGGRMRRAADILAALSLGAGLSVNNAAAVLRGFFRRGPSVFVRTPKTGATTSWRYAARLPPPLVAAELALAMLHFAAMVQAVRAEVWGALPFFFLFATGFAYLSLGTLLDARRARRSRRARGVLWSGAAPKMPEPQPADRAAR